MNLSQLRYFRKLAQVQHFTRAAEELFITQPALSNSIKQLEGELGIPLFEQHGRNVRLTKFGKEFNEYVSEGRNMRTVCRELSILAQFLLCRRTICRLF